MAMPNTELELLQAEKAQLELEQLEAEKAELLAAEQESLEPVTGAEPSELVQNVGKYAGAIAQLPERYVSAPIRAAALPIAAEGIKGLAKAPSAFAEQFGNEPEEAPSYEEVLKVAGVPSEQYPLPEFEPAGLGIGRAPIEELAGLPPEMKGPEKARTSEMLASGIEQAFDPTAALALGASRAAKSAKFLTPGVASGVKTAGGAAVDVAGSVLSSAAKQAGEISGMAVTGDISKGIRAGQTAGRTAEMLVDQVKRLPETVQKTFQNMKAEVRPQYIEQVNLAARTGIPDKLITNNAVLIYGPDAFITKAEKTRAQFGVSDGSRSFEDLGNEINRALSKQVDKISGRKVIDNQILSGKALKASYERAVSDLFDENQVRYSTISQQLDDPEKAVLGNTVRTNLQVKFNELIETERKQLEFASTSRARRVHKDNLRTLEAVQSNLLRSAGSIENVVKQLQQIGKEAYSDKYRGLVPNVVDTAESKRVLKNIYGELQFAIERSVEEIDPQIAASLRQSNAAQSEFLTKASQFSDILGNKNIAPETAYQQIILGGDSDMLKAIKELLGDTPEFEQVRGQALLDMLKRDVKDQPSFVSSAKQLNSRQGRMIQGLLFEPGEIKDFKDLVTLGVDSGVKNINTSSTGVVNFIKAAFSNPLEAIESMATGEQFVNVLKKESMKDYFKDLTIPQMLDLRGKGLFDDTMLDDVISDKMSQPEIRAAYRDAAKAGTLTPDVMSHLMTLVKEAPPVTSYSIVRDYMLKSGQDVGIGLLPGSMPLERATKVLLFINRVQRQQGSVPVMIPEEDREPVKQALMESGMSSIQKAKNLRSLNSSGYILDLSNFAPEEIRKQVELQMAEERQKALIEKQKASDLKADRPDVLKRMMDSKK